MSLVRFTCALLVSALAFAAGDANSTLQTATRVEQSAARLPAPMAMTFRMYAAQSLQPRHPEMARKFIDAVLAELRSGKSGEVPPEVIHALAELAPDDAIATLPARGPDVTATLIGALAQDHGDQALALYRSARAEGKVPVTASAALIARSAHTRPAVATALFQEAIAAYSFDHLEPWDAWWLLTTAQSASAASPTAAADLYERILTAVSAPDYGANSKSSITATFQIGSATVATNSSRDSLLLAAAGRLHALAPERLEKFHAVLTQWDLSGAVTLRGYTMRPPGAPSKGAEDPEVLAAIRKGIGQFRGLPTDADRAKLALEVAAKIRTLPGGAGKLSMASGLCNVVTEGDLGKEALTAAASALGQALRETKSEPRNWMELANLVRYEHVPAPFADPSLDAAGEVLALREKLMQENTFTLTGMDGKKYSLADLRGKVVLLNFWATWCPPCRKEMPDMEKLYRTFGKKGLVVLAVSDEARETVAKFLEKQDYTFPVLLDPDRKVNEAFAVEGIPKSFLFDREGKIVARAIDMRTERQFLEMLKDAGIE